MASPWPIDVVPVGQVTAGAVVWRRGGQQGVTLVVKATFALVHGGRATRAEPAPIARLDQHFDRSPLRSVETAGDLAIYRPAADVTFVGHAHAPPGRPAPAVSVRIGVFRDGGALLDKTLHVFGDRDLAGGRPSAPRPFQRMPVVYERALASAENPIGVAPSTGKAPNVVDPKNGPVVAGFGPISRYWPQRKALLQNVDRKRFEAPEPDVDDAFPWAYFQAAPADQRIGFLRGDEWIVLDGLHPALPRMQAQLPGARGVARITTFSPSPVTRPVELVADTLAIDGDALTASLVWRAPVPVSGEAELAAMRAYAGVEIAGAAVDWPDPHALPPPSVRARGGPAPRPAATDLDRTRAVTQEDAAALGALIAPFPIAPPSAPDAPPRSPVVPWRKPGAEAEGPGPSEEDHTMIGTLPVSGNFAPFPIAPPSAPDAPPRATEIPWLAAHAPAAPPDIVDAPTMDLPLLAMPPLDPIAASHEPPPAAPSGSDVSRWFHVASRGGGGGVAPVPEPGGIEPPRRKAPAIPIVNETPLCVATMPWQMKPPQDSLTFIVKGTFDLVHEGRASLRAECDFPMGDLHFDDDETKSLLYGSDFAVWKPRGDVTVTGSARAPGGSAPAAEVELSFGSSLRRRVAVFGDRRWQRGLVSLGQTAPEPFVTMPLTWERAFGGPKFEPNPCGTGHKGAPGDPLPNLEDPANLVSSPGDTPPPACFAPVPITWNERASKLGTYGGRYLKTRWPYFPEDFDYAYFQTAPRAQQVDHLAGDEPYAVAGMHPAHPKIQGTLPGLRPRCFVEHTREAGGGFVEVPLRLDTAAFDMDASKVNLVWRGVLDVTDEEAPEINAIFVMAEQLAAAPALLEDAQARYRAAATKPRDEPPPAPAPQPPPANDVPEEPPEDEATAEDIARDKQLFDDLRAAGVPEAELNGTAPLPPPADPQALAASMRENGATEEDIAALLEALAPEPDEPPPPVPGDLRARVLALLAEGADLSGLDLSGADLSDLDLGGRSLTGTRLKGAVLKRASLARADLTGAQLSGADLEGARLDEANLTGADLVLVQLTGASLAGAILTGADLTGASAAGASFEGASAAQAQLAGGEWKGARFDGADLTAADLSGSILDGASFRGAILAEARLYDVRGDSVVFDEARMPGARVESAVLSRASFRSVDAPTSVWERATLDEAIFHGANLEGASFERASCRRAVFAAAEIKQGRFRRAVLAGASFLKSNLMEAVFERADLTGADLRGANLHAAETWRAKLDGARLDLALVTGSKLAKEQR